MENHLEFKIHDRQHLEHNEDITLAPYATKSRGCHKTRRFKEPEHTYRTAFQRDRDRIIHSRAFRRLKHKRQVFLTTESDHYRTRMTHTLEVAQLSRTMARALGLNEDLTEAIALGHDLGHTPFGHLGEVVLNQVMTGAKTFPSQERKQNFGGFKHNYQSVRVVDLLEKKYTFNGLNLTAPVREGILKHTRLRRGDLNYEDFVYDGLRYELDAACTLEGQVVAICDEIAQRTHDLEDGLRAGLVDIRQVRELRIVRLLESKAKKSKLDSRNPTYRDLMIRGLINYLVRDVIVNTLANLREFQQAKNRLSQFDQEIVGFSRECNPLQKELNKFIYKQIIDYSRVNWADELGEKLIYRLFEVYFENPTLLPDYLLNSFSSSDLLTIRHEGRFFRTVCDHIAGMTDHFALHEAQRLAALKKFDVRDLHLEVALGANPTH